MIEQLIGHITQEQIDAIVNTIMEQYRKYLRLINSNDFLNIFAEEYKPHKGQHSVSWAISSAFPSNMFLRDDLKIDCLRYGKGHARPELSNPTIVLHILNKTTHFQADYLKQYYQKNKDGFINSQLYCFFKFSVENRRLKKISLCLPNENGAIIKEEMLLNEQAIIRLAA